MIALGYYAERNHNLWESVVAANICEWNAGLKTSLSARMLWVRFSGT